MNLVDTSGWIEFFFGGENASHFVEHFKNAVRNTKGCLPLEIIALDFNSGLEALGEIIGQTANEEIIDKIFSEFCLGK